MIYLTNGEPHPQDGVYHISTLNEEGFRAGVTEAFDTGELKVHIVEDGYDTLSYLENFLGFRLPDTPHIVTDDESRVKVTLAPGDSVVHFSLHPPDYHSEPDPDTDAAVLCRQYLLYGEGVDAVALHCLHTCPDDGNFHEWMSQVYAVATEFVMRTAEAVEAAEDGVLKILKGADPP